jgi:hypothetical protein
MTYWISTKSPVRMLDYQINTKISEYLIENQGIDASILASALGLQRDRVHFYQLRLGLRKHAVPGRRKSIG